MLESCDAEHLCGVLRLSRINAVKPRSSLQLQLRFSLPQRLPRLASSVDPTTALPGSSLRGLLHRHRRSQVHGVNLMDPAKAFPLTEKDLTPAQWAKAGQDFRCRTRVRPSTTLYALQSRELTPLVYRQEEVIAFFDVGGARGILLGEGLCTNHAITYACFTSSSSVTVGWGVSGEAAWYAGMDHDRRRQRPPRSAHSGVAQWSHRPTLSSGCER